MAWSTVKKEVDWDNFTFYIRRVPEVYQESIWHMKYENLGIIVNHLHI